jgi:hypothetical protein
MLLWKPYWILDASKLDLKSFGKSFEHSSWIFIVDICTYCIWLQVYISNRHDDFLMLSVYLGLTTDYLHSKFEQYQMLHVEWLRPGLCGTVPDYGPLCLQPNNHVPHFINKFKHHQFRKKGLFVPCFSQTFQPVSCIHVALMKTHHKDAVLVMLNTSQIVFEIWY